MCQLRPASWGGRELCISRVCLHHATAADTTAGTTETVVTTEAAITTVAVVTT